MYYAGFGILAIVIHIIINFEALWKSKKGGNFELRSRFRYFLISLIVYYAVDAAWGLITELKIVPAVYASTVLFFVGMAVTVLMWIRWTVTFLKDNVFTRIISVVGWIIFILVIVTVLVNIFFPVMFSVGPEGEYAPGYARYAVLGLQLLLFAVLGIYTLIRSATVNGQDRLHHRAVGISGIVMVVFIILQDEFLNIPFYTIGCLIATSIVHTFVEEGEKTNYNKELGSVKQIAFKDTLTNVRNKNSFEETKKIFDEKIWKKNIREFGLIIFDLNDLKKVNDTQGHEAGDRYIREASKMICETYRHSPVFRIGGDEFVALLEGEDYRNRGFLFRVFNEKVEGNQKFGGPVVSAGMDIFYQDLDLSVDDVFKRADEKMYERKKELKSRHIDRQ